MEKTCFVVMPFGGQFDEIYSEIYKPAIQAMGLKPLRADDIYDNPTHYTGYQTVNTKCRYHSGRSDRAQSECQL